MGVFGRVLVGFDGSASARHAFALAVQLAAEDGEVVALAVLPPVTRPETHGGRERAAVAARHEVEGAFDQLRDVAAHRRVDTRLKVVEGRHVAEALAGYADEHGFDLVVVGRHGSEGVVHPHLGHVAQALTRNPRLAVLLPRPRERR